MKLVAPIALVLLALGGLYLLVDTLVLKDPGDAPLGSLVVLCVLMLAIGAVRFRLNPRELREPPIIAFGPGLAFACFVAAMTLSDGATAVEAALSWLLLGAGVALSFPALLRSWRALGLGPRRPRRSASR